MKNRKVYFAKPDQTYAEHVYSVYDAWKQIVNYKKHLIKGIANEIGFKVEEFLKLSLLTILLHDLGKLIPPFQAIMDAKREHRNVNYKNNYRHEICSLPFLLFSKDYLIKDKSLKFPYELFAVAGHHKILDITLKSFERELYFKEEPSVFQDALNDALNIMENIFRQEGYDLDINSIKFIKYEGRSILNKMITSLSQLVNHYNGNVVRIIYILTKGILHYADWHGSAKVPVTYKTEKTKSDVISNIKERCLNKGIEFKGLRKFQEEVANIIGDAIAIAPTGSGKTEASILWALNNIEDMEYAKLIYLLPTMATANSMWFRLAELFGSDNVGLAHSSAKYFFEHEEELFEYELNNIKERDLLFDRSFIRPVTVGTVDQILNMGFNSRHWAVKEINAMNAVFVIDEIHAYDGWTMGLIMKTIEHLNHYGARFLLMSATMPQYMINLFKKYLPQAQIVRDTQLLNEKRSKYYVFEDKYIQEADEEIVKALDAGHKVLVVVNTVGLCQQLAMELKEYNPVCFHSRFIQKDRKRIEKSIDNANIVIATQAVEVSLDIDFDWLFTECAPPDALAQRAGRVNRYRDPQRDSRVFIFKANENSEKLYNPLNDRDLLLRTINVFKEAPKDICERDIIDIIQRVYSNYQIEETEAYQHAIEMYSIGQKNRLFILDDPSEDDNNEKTRLQKYETINVIPLCFYDTVIDLSPAERAEYEVRIPYWYFLKHGKIYDGIAFCDLHYDNYLGAILKEDSRTVFIED